MMRICNLFSCTNSDTRKIISIFGIKIKIRKTKILRDFLKQIYSLKIFEEYFDKKYSYLSSKYCNDSKNALLIYNYSSTNKNYYNKNGAINIGDYIQSLAAKQYLSEPFVSIDRDKLSLYEGDNVNLIMNGWYFLYEDNCKPSYKINPLFVAIHINNTYSVSKETINYLKQYEPIGCRDYQTRNFLLSRGVKAYFSSCLTTTLDIKYKKQDVERSGIIFCDFKFGENKKIDKYVNKILLKYKNENIENTRHTFLKDENLSSEDCFKIAEELLEKYSKSKLVITTRIHCALPCLALGTPVILILKSYDKLRFNGLSRFLNIVGVKSTNTNRISNKVNFDKMVKL